MTSRRYGFIQVGRPVFPTSFRLLEGGQTYGRRAKTGPTPPTPRSGVVLNTVSGCVSSLHITDLLLVRFPSQVPAPAALISQPRRIVRRK